MTTSVASLAAAASVHKQGLSKVGGSGAAAGAGAWSQFYHDKYPFSFNIKPQPAKYTKIFQLEIPIIRTNC